MRGTSSHLFSTPAVHVDIPPRFGLPYRSMVMLEQLRTIDEVRLGDYLGFLTGDVMDKIDDALEISVGLRPIVPNQPKKDEAEEMLLCLCPVCAQQFFTFPGHIIRRVDPLQVEKTDCDYCQVRTGYDYRIRCARKQLGSDRP